MKEINFLPEWYKNGRRRRITYRTQYAVLGCVFVMMIVWSVFASYSVAKVKAKLSQGYEQQMQAETVLREYEQVKAKVAQLQARAETVKRIRSRIVIPHVLAELSYLMDEGILLRSVVFKAERFTGQADKNNGGSVTKAKLVRAGDKAVLFPAAVRFRVVINGVATDAADVAELICRLEDSPYFREIYPSYSRNKQIKVSQVGTESEYEVSEFEIACYLANYELQPHEEPKEITEKGLDG